MEVEKIRPTQSYFLIRQIKKIKIFLIFSLFAKSISFSMFLEWWGRVFDIDKDQRFSKCLY